MKRFCVQLSEFLLSCQRLEEFIQYPFLGEAFGDSAIRITNTYIILSNSGWRGVVDTSLGHDCLE